MIILFFDGPSCDIAIQLNLKRGPGAAQKVTMEFIIFQDKNTKLNYYCFNRKPMT